MAWVLASGLAILVPVFLHGWILGPFYLLAHSGLIQQPSVHARVYQNADLTNSLIPWWDTVWQQVHHGHLPIWNPYGGLGMPLAFNWQSAPLSLPALVGYLAPLKYSFTVGVVVNIVVTGSGAYVLGRVLGMGTVASAAVGTVFELSGPITAWLGYPFPAVMSWGGWIFAIGLLMLRGRHRIGCIVALAVCMAFALFGGAPEGFIVLILAATVFFAVMLVSRAGWLGGSGAILRPTVDLVVATVTGCALAAPFALPGFQLSSTSVRKGAETGTLEPHALTYLAIPAFDGLPLFQKDAHVIIFGYTYFYTQTAMYVGVIALVLAGMAIVIKRRRPEVQGFFLVAVLGLALTFAPPVVYLAERLPVVGDVGWVRALMPMALAVAVLAGYGIDLVVRSAAARRTGRRLGLGFVIAAAVLISIWVFGRGHLEPVQVPVREHSFIWPGVEIIIGLGVAGFLLLVGRRQRLDRSEPSGSRGAGNQRQWIVRWSGTIAGLVLLLAQVAFLVSSGATMVESGPQSFPQTPVTEAFTAAVGSSTVAFGSTLCGLGIDPNANDAYGVHELEVYDPIIPKKFFSDWTADTGSATGLDPAFNLFCPVVTTAGEGREFGVSYVLEAAGQPGPTGSVYVRHLGDEDLYRIPGAGEATVSPLVDGALPPDQVAGTPVGVGHPVPSEWELTTSSTDPQVLRLHLSDVPGWQATIDGKPLALEQYAGLMMQARIPPGTHTIVLHYWPKTLTEGIILACCSVAFLVILLIVGSVRKRRRLDGERPTRGPSVPLPQ